MNKQNKVVSAQFLKALKSTPQMPLKIQNHKPTDYQMQKQVATKQFKDSSNQYKRPTVIEDDILKIAKVYVPDGQIMKKVQKNQRVNHSLKNNSDQKYNDEIMTLKEKVRLQYLQKKGFLRPQEQQALQRVRSQKMIPIQPLKIQKKQTKKQNLTKYHDNYDQIQEKLSYYNNTQKSGLKSYDPYYLAFEQSHQLQKKNNNKYIHQEKRQNINYPEFYYQNSKQSGPIYKYY